MTIHIRYLILLMFTGFFAKAHSDAEHKHSSPVEFKENKGQWHSNVLYRADIQGAAFFLEKKGFTFSLFSPEQVNEIHNIERKQGLQVANSQRIKFHGLKVSFEGAGDAMMLPSEPLAGINNYYLGNIESKWATNVLGYSHIRYIGLYPGIDLSLYSEDGAAKYDFIVAPGADPNLIAMKYDGGDYMSIDETGSLIIGTSVGNYSEMKPIAYQMINGKKKFVSCVFAKEGQTIQFSLGRYNKQLPLIIDPVVVASTYSGGAVTTYGHSAAYDDLGNVITGGRCFGAGYPITPGAFDATFGGSVDMAVTKLNPTGSARIYSTYIGGSNDEYVHSMFSTANGDLILYGSCASPNYPTTAGCYDASHNGLYDIVISKLNSTGTALIGSTFLGGTGNDGQNAIAYNYGDPFRGEVIADAAGIIYVASFSSSNNFPAAGSIDNTQNGGQDGVVIKMDATLTTRLWATFIGGSGEDAAYGLKLDAGGFGLYIAGVTNSTNFPVQAGAIHPTYLGGGMDGWLVYLAASGVFTLASTYIGTSGYDQAYFIQLDAQNSVYLYGITEGNLPITPGCYGVVSGDIFIMKFPFNISAVTYQTCLGSNSGTNFSPTAFLVDNCKKVYISGWGDPSSYAITTNAVSASGGFYVAVMDQNATSLVFATRYGGGGFDHVDGGTSRFDSRGVVYQSVCCGSTTFPTLPGSVSPTKNGSAGWDIAVFKIDMQLSEIEVTAAASPSLSGCVPYTVNFNALPVGGSPGVVYSWNYDDGTTPDSIKSPSHTFTAVGSYDVTVIVFDSTTCNERDTFLMTIDVLSGPADPFPADTLLCPGSSLTLSALNTGANYSWSTGATTQTISVNSTGLYYVDISLTGCQLRDSINVLTLSSISIGPDSTICSNDSIFLDPGVSGASYLWSTGATTQSIYANTSGTYWVEISASGCQLRDSMLATVNALPNINLGSDTTLCPSASITLNAGNAGANYLWSNGTSLQTLAVNSAGTYWVEAANGNCIDRDSIVISFLSSISIGPDSTICDSSSILLDPGFAGATYLWSTTATTQSISVNTSGTYWVQVSTAGCQLRDTMIATVNVIPVIDLGSDTTLCPGNTMVLDADNAGASYLWSGGTSNQTYTVTTDGTYWVEASNGNCRSRDSIDIVYSIPLSSTSDTTLCNGLSFTIQATGPGAFTWSDGTNGTSLIVNTTGIYWVESNDNGCIQRDTTVVTFATQPVVDIGADDVLCPGDTLILDATNTGASYLWQDGSTSPTFTVTGTGIYYVTASAGNCFDRDTIDLFFEPKLVLAPDTGICELESVTLSTPLSGLYLWSNGSTSPSITVTQAGTYVLTLSTTDCVQRDTVVVSVQPLPIVDFGADTTLCPGANLVLDATNTNATYFWQNGTTANQFAVTYEGQFWVDVTINSCTTRDSIYVNYEPVLELGPDDTICVGLSYALASPITGTAYQWSDGSTTSAISITQSGNYALTLTTQYCVQTDDVDLTVLPIPEVDLGPDSLLCEGESITLDAGTNGNDYLWSDGSIGQTLFVDQTGTISVAVNDGYCTGYDTVRIDVADFNDLNLTLSICNQTELILQAQKNGTSFLWSTGETTPEIVVKDTGMYWVETKIGRCSVRDTLHVEGAPGFSAVYLPRAFSPNNDGKNDQFFGAGERLDEFSIRIFNRWGQEVFYSNSTENGWDGKYQGAEVPEGIYMYKVRYKTPCNKDRSSEKTGAVTLLR